MNIECVIIAVVLISILILVLYLVKRNQKDKDEVIRFFNETEIPDDPKHKDEDMV